jgi:hypothetical protein
MAHATYCLKCHQAAWRYFVSLRLFNNTTAANVYFSRS